MKSSKTWWIFPRQTSAIEELKCFRGILLPGSFVALFLSQGIAIHNADLSWEERDLVERYFRKGR